MEEPPPKSGWLERLGALLIRKPEDREQLITVLHSAFERNLLDSDALSMIEGVMQVSEMQARDIMVPRSQMDIVDISDTPEKFIPFVIEAAHSRFPVTEGSEDNIIGILLAKDLLRYYASEEEFAMRDMLRPAVFIPESKRLNVLLKDFRSNRNHMAIVVNEYGGVAGLVTIEDVLEPYLIQQGYIQRTPRGRIATLNTYAHFGLTAPASLAGTHAANLQQGDLL